MTGRGMDNVRECPQSVDMQVQSLLDERGASYKRFSGSLSGSMEPYSKYFIHEDDGSVRASIQTNGLESTLVVVRCTPEQAVDAALGSVLSLIETGKRDQNAYEEGYADGFDRGEEAIVQQIDGLLDANPFDTDAVCEIADFIADFWKERES